ncbi:hypothetical protein CRUP_037758 [Coryphaenoides rupestris]|nr:hypothetical protein CRUP_037758 [Coryphaenoides rupestris]
MTQSAEPCWRRLFCQRNMSSFTDPFSQCPSPPTPSPLGSSPPYPSNSRSPSPSPPPSASRGRVSISSSSSSSTSTLDCILRLLDSSSAMSRASLVCSLSTLPSSLLSLISTFSPLVCWASVDSSRMPILVRICRPFSSRWRLATGNSASTTLRSSLDRLNRSEWPMLRMLAHKLLQQTLLTALEDGDLGEDGEVNADGDLRLQLDGQLLQDLRCWYQSPTRFRRSLLMCRLRRGVSPTVVKI